MDPMRITRRELIGTLAASGAAAGSPRAIGKTGSEKTFVSIVRQPDGVTVFEGLDKPLVLRRASGEWSAPGVQVRIDGAQDLDVTFSAPGVTPTHVRLRWSARVSPSLLYLGDTWERSYGDLLWEPSIPQRVMPWYAVTWDGRTTHGYGVRTGASALCFWQIDPDGISLWMDVRNGGAPVQLGERDLLLATVVAHEGSPHENPATAVRSLCASLCRRPRPLPPIVYGSNDWYYAYGKNNADQILHDAELVASLAPAGAERPFTVIDDGWKNTAAYGDMGVLAANIRKRGARPGLWIRPLQAPASASPALLLPANRLGSNEAGLPAYDPTNGDALQLVLEKVRQAVNWGYDLVKHDYTTVELFGQWGVEMGAQPALDGWSFSDRSKTNAEIVLDLYRQIRKTAGEQTVLIGFNTIGHLSAGIFEIQRTGDDTSGKLWERTRRMGVNTLAYRYPQHRTFFVVDADCVPITVDTPWEMNRQWLDLVARSGTALFVSPQPQATGSAQLEALRVAFALAAREPADVAALDWHESATPKTWRFETAGDRMTKTYDWFGSAGAWPFDV